MGFAQAVRAGRLLSAELTEQFLTPQVLHHERDDWEVWYGFGLEFVIDRAPTPASLAALATVGENTSGQAAATGSIQ